MSKGTALQFLQSHKILKFLQTLDVAAYESITQAVHLCRINAGHLGSIGLNPSLLTGNHDQWLIGMNAGNNLVLNLGSLGLIGLTYIINREKTQRKNGQGSHSAQKPNLLVKRCLILCLHIL